MDGDPGLGQADVGGGEVARAGEELAGDHVGGGQVDLAPGRGEGLGDRHADRAADGVGHEHRALGEPAVGLARLDGGQHRGGAAHDGGAGGGEPAVEVAPSGGQHDPDAGRRRRLELLGGELGAGAQLDAEAPALGLQPVGEHRQAGPTGARGGDAEHAAEALAPLGDGDPVAALGQHPAPPRGR